MSTTALRTSPPARVLSPDSGELLACPSCHQEMLSPDADLPLHRSQGRLCAGSGTKGGPSKGGQAIRQPLLIPDISELSISEILAANTCLACGGPKTPGQTICPTCHGLLPFIHQKMLPDFIRGYLYIEEKQDVGGIKKREFMDVFKSALAALAEMRNAEGGGSV